MWPVGHGYEYSAPGTTVDMAAVVTFDAGQTLIDLDLDFLVDRLGERGLVVGRDALAGAAPAAWRRYDALVDAVRGHPWQAFMTSLLAGAGVPGADLLAEWLWTEQPAKNLWRKPIAGMVELARELGARGVRVGVLSNSEGGLAHLLEEIGIANAFGEIVDSGRVGIEKPDPRIFAHALGRLGGGQPRAHIGDSWAADVEGAVAAGWQAIWFQSRAAAPPRELDVPVARTPEEVRAILAGWGIG